MLVALCRVYTGCDGLEYELRKKDDDGLIVHKQEEVAAIDMVRQYQVARLTHNNAVVQFDIVDKDAR